MTKQRAIYRVTLTEKQNAKMLKCGDESLEVGAFFSEVSKNFTHFVNTVELMFLLGFFNSPIQIETMG